MAIFFLCVMVLLGLESWAGLQRTMKVTCYRGKSRIGTVTVFDWRAAAATCNAVLYDCKGACTACFRDLGYINDVCVDTHGNEFLR